MMFSTLPNQQPQTWWMYIIPVGEVLKLYALPLIFSIPETHSHQASENKWLEDDSFPLGIWPIFRGSSPVVSGRVHRLHDTHP